MTSILQPNLEFTVLIPFPTSDLVFKEYLEFMEMVKTPPLLMVAEFALAAYNSFRMFDGELAFEWVENELIRKLYNELEEEALDISEQPYNPYLELPKRPVHDYLNALTNEPYLTRFNIFVKELSQRFLYLYAFLPFPEQFSDLDPFYEYSINLLNPETAMLKITEKEDVEFFTGFFS